MTIHKTVESGRTFTVAEDDSMRRKLKNQRDKERMMENHSKKGAKNEN